MPRSPIRPTVHTLETYLVARVPFFPLGHRQHPMIHLWPSFITLPVLTPSHRRHAPICIASTPRRALSPLQHQRQRRSDPSSDRQTLLTTKLDPVVVTHTRKLELQDTGGVHRILWPSSGCNTLTQLSRTEYPYQKLCFELSLLLCFTFVAQHAARARLHHRGAALPPAYSSTLRPLVGCTSSKRLPSPTASTMGVIGAPHGVPYGHLLGLIVRQRWAAQRPYPPRRARLGSSIGYSFSLGLRTAKLQLVARVRQVLIVRITRSSCVDSTKFASSRARASVLLCTRSQVNKFVRASKLRRKSEVILRGGLGLSLVLARVQV
ncbi:hypothetical protein DFH06DRAFT_1187804 [Mycena polygramma]|nr:hypothetical protein DFH06DRAFT_1187804 [Mycena polygramma]